MICNGSCPAEGTQSQTMPPRKITLIRAALPIKCPECGAAISWRHATGHVQFLCPECGHGLHLRNNYFRVLYLFAAILVTMVAYAAGIRSDALFATVILGVWPTHLLLVFIAMISFRPMLSRLEISAASCPGPVVLRTRRPALIPETVPMPGQNLQLRLRKVQTSMECSSSARNAAHSKELCCAAL